MDECQNVIAFNDLEVTDDATTTTTGHLNTTSDCMNMVIINRMQSFHAKTPSSATRNHMLVHMLSIMHILSGRILCAVFDSIRLGAP